MKELTARQQQVLHFIQNFTDENVFPPSVREIAEHFSISIKAVQDHIAALRKKGYLSQSAKRSRSLKVLKETRPEVQKTTFVEIPLLGTIAAGKPLFCDEVKIKEVIIRKNKIPFRENAKTALYGKRISVDEGTEKELIIPFSEISAVSVLGRNKLNVYYGNKVYQFSGSKRFNALKYVNIWYRWKNISEGNENGKFLGL